MGFSCFCALHASSQHVLMHHTTVYDATRPSALRTLHAATSWKASTALESLPGCGCVEGAHQAWEVSFCVCADLTMQHHVRAGCAQSLPATRSGHPCLCILAAYCCPPVGSLTPSFRSAPLSCRRHAAAPLVPVQNGVQPPPWFPHRPGGSWPSHRAPWRHRPLQDCRKGPQCCQQRGQRRCVSWWWCSGGGGGGARWRQGLPAGAVLERAACAWC